MKDAAEFWSRVEMTDGCWLWKGAQQGSGYRTGNGYGELTRRRQRPKGPLKAHRVAYELTYGPVPPGMEVCHDCDNPPCVRPDHLFLGTHRHNMRDAWAKGRIRKPPTLIGEDHTQARLSVAEVVEIRQRLAAGEAGRALASKFQVSRSLISAIKNRLLWRHV